jgi:hypothetical protein
MGGGQLPSDQTMAGNLTRQTCEPAHLASGIHFYGPARGAAPVDTTVLANLESTLREIAVAISKRRPIPNKRAIAHLAIHLDHIVKVPCALEDIASLLDKAFQQPGYSKYQMATHLSDLSCYQCAGKLEWFLDKLQGRWYTVSWLLEEIMELAAIPSHPQRSRGGGTHEGLMAPLPTHQRATKPSPSSASPPSPARPAPSHPQRSMGASQEGLMAPSPNDRGATKPSTSLAMPSVPARLTTTPTCPSQGLLFTLPPPTTTGGGATAAEHRATMTLFCWVQRTWLHCWFHKHRRQRLQTLCRGASAYAASVWGDRQPPPTLINKTSDPKVLCDPFRDRGQPLPQRRWARRTNRPCRRPG